MKPTIYRFSNFDKMSKDDLITTIKMLHDYIDTIQKNKCNLEMMVWSKLSMDEKELYLRNEY
jgi:hypothetical protein